MVYCISLSSCQMRQHCFSFFYNSINSTTTNGMNPSKRYRIWSLVSQNYLVLTKNGNNLPTIFCTGTGKEQTSKNFWSFNYFTLLVQKSKLGPLEDLLDVTHGYTVCNHILGKRTLARFMAFVFSLIWF